MKIGRLLAGTALCVALAVPRIAMSEEECEWGKLSTVSGAGSFVEVDEEYSHVRRFKVKDEDQAYTATWRPGQNVLVCTSLSSPEAIEASGRPPTLVYSIENDSIEPTRNVMAKVVHTPAQEKQKWEDIETQ